MTAVHTYPWGDGRTFEAVQLTLHNIDAVEEFVGGDSGVHPEGGLVFATTNGPYAPPSATTSSSTTPTCTSD